MGYPIGIPLYLFNIATPVIPLHCAGQHGVLEVFNVFLKFLPIFSKKCFNIARNCGIPNMKIGIHLLSLFNIVTPDIPLHCTRQHGV